MGWIRINTHFKQRGVVFVIPLRELVGSVLGKDIVVGLGGSEPQPPEALQDMVRDLIIAYRPDLESASLEFLNFDYNPQRVFIGLTHPSLPEMEAFQNFPRMWLSPSEEESSPYDQLGQVPRPKDQSQASPNSQGPGSGSPGPDEETAP